MNTLIISNFKTGYERDLEPFLINNDAFPILNNAYIFRGKILRKGGTSLLNRLRRDLTGKSLTGGAGTLDDNIVTSLSLESNSQIVPGSITLVQGAETFTEPATPDGTLTGDMGGTGTINYATGAITTDVAPPGTISFSYYPVLPVLGLEDFDKTNRIFPVLVAFDSKYSYQINQSTDNFYDTTFYKSTANAFTWSGDTYQQFYSENYKNALWVTNGKQGFHFKSITNVTRSGMGGVPATDTRLTITGHTLTTDDYIFVNEIDGIEDTAGNSVINGKTFQVKTVVDVNNVDVELDTSTATAYSAGGIAQYLTQSTSSTEDGIRFYDGDPTSSSDFGWVNFSPPLDNTLTPSYLVGAKIIIAFKDRLLFFGTYERTSAGSVQFYPNRLRYSQNGTPYYHSLIPADEGVSFQANSWYQNISGKGGFLDAPVQQKISTVEENEDVLICKFEKSDRKLIFTGDDTFPFFYKTINSELGAFHSFSGIALDNGVLSIGNYGFTFTNQTSSKRFDEQIPDQVFDIAIADNADEQVTAVRDFRNEFVRFTYRPKDRDTSNFPSKTLLYNYKENNFATLDENYTHFGYYRKSAGYTWATLPYKTWTDWLKPWNYGSSGARFPFVIGGNQQGFVLITNFGSRQDDSNYITTISGSTITSPDHCLNDGDYIEISNIIGTDTISALNGTIQRVKVANDSDTFEIETTTTTGSYSGGGTFRIIPNFIIQSKMFPNFWGNGRQIRVGMQRYLFDNSSSSINPTDPVGEILCNIFTSQNDNFASSDPVNSDFLPFTNVVLTGPEPDSPYQINQKQIWHSVNNSFVGDSIQVGMTLSDTQMRSNNINEANFGLNAIVLDVYPGPTLA